MLQDYKKHCKEREEQGIPPLPLSAQQTSDLVELLKSEHKESELLLNLLKERSLKKLKLYFEMKLRLLSTPFQTYHN